MKERLFTPGPTPVPERVISKMGQPLVHHRSKEFSALLQEVTEGLRYVFQTESDVLILTSSGTGAMEAAVANFLSPGDVVLTIEGGKFGERWTEICRAYGVQAQPIQVPWGKAVDPETVERQLRRHGDIQAIYLTHSETSTGVAHDVKSIANLVRQHSQALIIVDAISSLGALPLKTDCWGIDVVVGASQKALMIPPGLAFISVSARAWQRAQKAKLPTYYFDLKKAKKTWEERTTTPFTPAISLINGLFESLRMIREEGIEKMWARHKKLAEATRAGVQALGLKLFAESPSDALTAVRVPPTIDTVRLIKLLREKYGITVAEGQGRLKGKIFRIGHLGYLDHLDVISVVSVLEHALAEIGWEFEAGAGVKAVQGVYIYHDQQIYPKKVSSIRGF